MIGHETFQPDIILFLKIDYRLYIDSNSDVI